MPLFQHAEFAFDAPDQWRDGSLVALVAPAVDDVPPANLTITRDEVPAGTTSEDYAAQQLPGLVEAFADQQFQVLSQSNLAGASESTFCRTHRIMLDDETGMVAQHQAYLIRGTTALTLTLSDSIDRVEESEQKFKDIVASFRWAEDATA